MPPGNLTSASPKFPPLPVLSPATEAQPIAHAVGDNTNSGLKQEALYLWSVSCPLIQPTFDACQPTFTVK